MRKCLPLLVLFPAILLSNCATNQALLRYSDIEDMAIKKEKWEGKRLGRVYSDVGGAIWKDCSELARTNLRYLVMRAQDMGANALGQVVWLPHNQTSFQEPTCKKRWGWFALWPFILTPLFASADVEAMAYNVPGLEKDSESVYYIPNSDKGREELIDRLLALGK